MFRHTLINLALVASSIVFLALGAELSIRIYRTVKYREPFFRLQSYLRGPIEIDPELGWRAKPNYHSVDQVENGDGSEHTVNFTQDSHGFRCWGSLDSRRIKILVIGDSFTHATAASDDQTYYAVAGSRLGAEMFAYGCNGYGTLQEYMILDHYIDQIHPNLIVWQFCINDFSDNSLAVQARTANGNMFFVKPFWDHGRIEYALPVHEQLGRYVPYWLQNSRLFGALAGRVRILHARWWVGQESYVRMANGDPQYHFAQAIAITDRLVAMVRRRAGNTPIIGINCDCREPYASTMKSIASRHGIEWAGDDVLRAVNDAERRGVQLRAADKGHWNHVGNQIAGEALAEDLRPFVERLRSANPAGTDTVTSSGISSSATLTAGGIAAKH